MGVPPASARRGILRKYLGRYAIPDKTITYLSQQENVSPAQIEKAAKVLALSGDSVANREATLLLVVENSMALLEQHQNDPNLNLTECSYRLEYLNPDCDL